MTNASAPAQRLQNIPPYPFATMALAVRELAATGADVIRLDIGSPDQAPAPHILQALTETAQREDAHGYGGYVGIPAFREAMAHYYQQRFGVHLDPQKQIVPLIGSKEGIANLHLAWLNPGDIALIPDPGYSAYITAPYLADGTSYPVPLDPAQDWRPDFEALPSEVLQRARLLWLNYPNNPTGAVVDLTFFEEVIAFCKQHQLLFCHDNPYADVTFDGYQAVSPLQIPGAEEVVLEVNSLSKTYNMAAWRVGMAVGNAAAVKALANVKTNIDSGIGLPVQHMAIAAMTGDQSWIQTRNQTLQKRRDRVIATLRRLGIEVAPPKGTLYIWFPVPPGYTDVELHQKWLHEGHISIAPGSIYGEQGRGWMRLSISVPDDRLQTALERLEAVRL